jgi:hypothetical protein
MERSKGVLQVEYMSNMTRIWDEDLGVLRCQIPCPRFVALFPRPCLELRGEMFPAYNRARLQSHTRISASENKDTIISAVRSNNWSEGSKYKLVQRVFVLASGHLSTMFIAT